MFNFINCTPHAIVLNNGTVYPPSGDVARVSASFTEFQNGICSQVFGEITGLPDPVNGTFYIVSAMVLGANTSRIDLVAPATGHPDTIRNDKGHIVSVPGFVK